MVAIVAEPAMQSIDTFSNNQTSVIVSELAPELSKNPVLLNAEGLSCCFNGQTAVEDFNLALRRGEVLGLVGLNGAGKSTALRMLCGLLAPDAGTIKVGDYSLMDQPEDARRLLGYLPDPPALHGCLRVSEAIDINARLHGLNKKQRALALEKVLHQCQLESVKDKPIATLSKGFRQRTGLAQALVHEPSVLILDEPASGLDPAQTQHLNTLIKELAADRAIVFSSHAIADVQSCCTRVALLQSGKLIHDQQRDHQKTNTSFFKLELREFVSENSLLALSCVENLEAIDAHTWHIELKGENPDAILAAVLSNGWGLRALTPHHNAISAVLGQLHSRPSAKPEAA